MAALTVCGPERQTMHARAMTALFVLAKEVGIVILIATLSSLVAIVNHLSSPEVIAALVSGGLTLATHFCRFWLRARERRKSEAQQWREGLEMLLREQIATRQEIAELKERKS
jgi:hypothetical protein